MISTKESPIYFFECLLTNFNFIVEELFYSTYKSLDYVNINREEGIVIYRIENEDNESTVYTEHEVNFMTKRCNQEYYKSLDLIDEQVKKLVSLYGDANVYLTLIENRLVALYNLCIDNSKYNFRKLIELLILEVHTKYSSIHKQNTELKTLLKLILSNTLSHSKDNRILSFKWKREAEKLESLYLNLTTSNPPFIECDRETFMKAFNKGTLLDIEGIKWICLQTRNKSNPSYVTLIRFITLLFEKDFLEWNDFIDINKIIEHVFLSPSGESIKGKIKQSKREKSKYPSRYNELERIVERLLG